MGVRIFLGVLALVALLSFIVMSLWNGILVPVLHIGVISFWQALGIFILAKILFGFGGFRPGWGRKHEGGHFEWKRKMYERWQNMPLEEREKFKHEFRERCRSWKKAAEPRQEQAGAE